MQRDPQFTYTIDEFTDSYNHSDIPVEGEITGITGVNAYGNCCKMYLLLWEDVIYGDPSYPLLSLMLDAFTRELFEETHREHLGSSGDVILNPCLN